MSSLGEHFACTRRVQRPGRGGRRKGNEPSWLLAPEHLVSSPRTIIHSHYMWHLIITRHITSHQVILRQKTRGNVSPGHWSSSKHPRKSKVPDDGKIRRSSVRSWLNYFGHFLFPYYSSGSVWASPAKENDIHWTEDNISLNFRNYIHRAYGTVTSAIKHCLSNKVFGDKNSPSSSRQPQLI